MQRREQPRGRRLHHVRYRQRNHRPRAIARSRDDVGADSSDSYLTLIHELGHASGSGTGGPYNPGDMNLRRSRPSCSSAPTISRLWSIMSYVDPWRQQRGVLCRLSGNRYQCRRIPITPDDAGHPGGAAPLRRADVRPARKRRPGVRVQQQYRRPGRALLRFHHEHESFHHDLGRRAEQHARCLRLVDARDHQSRARHLQQRQWLRPTISPSPSTP